MRVIVHHNVIVVSAKLVVKLAAGTVAVALASTNVPDGAHALSVSILKLRLAAGLPVLHILTLNAVHPTHVPITGKLTLVSAAALQISCLFVATQVAGQLSTKTHCPAVIASHTIYVLSNVHLKSLTNGVIAAHVEPKSVVSGVLYNCVTHLTILVASTTVVPACCVSQLVVHPLYICLAFKLCTYTSSFVTGLGYNTSLAAVLATTAHGFDCHNTFKSHSAHIFTVPVNVFVQLKVLLPENVLSCVALIIWSCISTNITGVHAIQLNQVQAVLGTAVLLKPLVNQVIVFPLLQVKLIRSSCAQLLR